MVLDCDRIAAMLPHAGSMCLLDAVLRWDETSIRCLSRRYARPDSPLRRKDGALGAVCGIEFAVQAMAAHGFLVATGVGRPSVGYLVSLRDVRLRTIRLDNVNGDLIIDAERLMGDAHGATYRFVIAVADAGRAGREVVRGRATVLLGLSAA